MDENDNNFDIEIEPDNNSSAQKRSKKQRYISLSRLFPNMITLTALCIGFSAIRFAILERWEVAVTFVVIAAVLDALDGAAARILNSSSNFGAQLDSLSDIVSFGVAPALIVHLWVLQDVKRFGWAVALIFVICCALRLARFNAMLQETDVETKAEEKNKKLVGVPAPGGALLALFPLALSFELTDFFKDYPWAMMIYMLIIATLMISKIPTFSVKNTKINHNMALPAMIGFGIFVALLIIEPWYLAIFVASIYLISLVYSYTKQLKQRNHQKLKN